eukprot:scaffold297519_cov18-Tisochrysis_lutea.AAC.1
MAPPRAQAHCLLARSRTRCCLCHCLPPRCPGAAAPAAGAARWSGWQFGPCRQGSPRSWAAVAAAAAA